MPNYAYEAQTQSGETVADQLAAASVSVAIAELEARGLTIRSIRTVDEEPMRPAPVEAPAFYQRIEAALARRDALIVALEALADDMANTDSARDLHELIAELRRGATAPDFVRHESAAVWLPLILRSPASRFGGEGFRQVLTEATRESDNRTMRRRMLFYPLTMLAVSLSLALVLLYSVVPSFSSMFQEFGLSLSGPTRTVMWLSGQLRESPLKFLVAMLLIALVAYALVRMWVHNALTSRLFGSWIAGNSLSVAAMARFAGTLGELLALEAPLADAIRIAGRASQHPYYREAAEELAREAQHAERALGDSGIAHVFPANVIYALGAGANGGPNIPLLRELSNIYSDRVSQRFDWSAGIIAPLTIAAAGMLVAFFILALLLPLMSLIQSLS